MRFAFYSVEGASLSWQRRLFDEGHEVLVFIDKKNGKWQQRVGDGLVPKTGDFNTWLQFGAAPGAITFFDFSGTGELADGLRRSGRLVIGGGTFCDKLEKDRPFGEAIAKEHDILAPPSYQFSTVSQSVAFLRKNPDQKAGDGGWAWKPNRSFGSDSTHVAKDTEKMLGWLERVAIPKAGDNNTCMLQERIKGVALSTARWWNGRGWVGPYEGTLEEKKFMPGDLGPSTGCSLNLVWFYPSQNPAIAEALQWERLADAFRKKDAPPGLYDINCIVDRRGAWFLEWTPRLGYDSELTSQRGITQLGAFLHALATGGDAGQYFDANKVYVGVRLTLPPYPDAESGTTSTKTAAMNVPILGGLDGLWDKHFVACGVGKTDSGMAITDPGGYVGVAVSQGSSLKGCCDDVYAYLKDLSIPNLQYRTDAEKIIQDDIDEMHKFGWETTPVLDAPDDDGDD